MISLSKKILRAVGTADGRRRLGFFQTEICARARCVFRKSDHFIYFRNDGTRFVYYLNDSFSTTLLHYRNFEQSEIRWCADWLGRGGLFVDGGANIGLFTAGIRQLNPAIKVLAVECNPPTFRAIQRTLKLLALQNVIVDSRALSDADGLWFKNSSHTDSALNSVVAVVETAADCVPSVSLSTLLKEHWNGNDEILIKLDLEGHEHVALKGLIPFLKTHPEWMPALLVEVSRSGSGISSMEQELWRWLQSHKYHTYFGGGFGRGPDLGTPIDANFRMDSTFNLIGIPNREDRVKLAANLFDRSSRH
jgi:FkbM family methyltransferase